MSFLLSVLWSRKNCQVPGVFFKERPSRRCLLVKDIASSSCTTNNSCMHVACMKWHDSESHVAHIVAHNWAASKTWLQRCSNPKVLSPHFPLAFARRVFTFAIHYCCPPAFAATFAVFRRKVLLLIMVVTKTYTCSLSRQLSRLFILKALSRSFRQAFARGVLAYAQHKNINVYLKPLHKGFWCCSIEESSSKVWGGTFIPLSLSSHFFVFADFEYVAAKLP